MKLRFKLALRLALLGIPAFACGALAAPVCEGVLIQAITGTGSNSKVGFICGTGCQKRFYLISSASAWDKCTTHTTTRNSTSCGTFLDLDHTEHEEVTGSNLSYLLAFDPTTCGTISSVNGSGSTVVRDSYHRLSYTSICQGGVIGASSCESVRVNGALVNPSQDCGTGSCDVNPPGYTLVSTTTVNDSCEGTKTVQVWQRQTDVTASVIVHEFSSSPGYKMEYTTESAVARAKTCAVTSLNNQAQNPGFPPGYVASGNAIGSMSIAPDKSSASYAASRWRLAVSGTSVDEQYEITLTWLERVNGRARTITEKRVTSGKDDLVWYYPGEHGENLFPKEATDCGYSYSKELLTATIAIQQKGEK